MNTLEGQKYTYKQVIVVRKDLGMRKGKMGAQVAHASNAAVLPRQDVRISPREDGRFDLTWALDEGQVEWFMNLSTKVVVGARDEEHLMDLYNQAVVAGLPCSLIQDRGFTEFGGVPTYTAIGIGPADEQEINKITGTLPLM